MAAVKSEEDLVRVHLYLPREVVDAYQELSELSGTPVAELYRMQLRPSVPLIRKAIKGYRLLGRRSPIEKMAALADGAT